MSLNEAILLGIRNSNDLHSSRLQQVVDKFAVFIEEQAFQPQITIDHHWQTQSGQKPTLTSDSDLSLKNKWGGTLGLRWQKPWLNHSDEQWQVYYQQPLLKTKIADIPLRLSQLNWQQQQLQYKQQHIDLVVEVIKAYRRLLQAQQRLSISQHSLARSEKLQRINTVLIETGRMPAVEMIQTEADIASKKLDERLAKNEQDSARLNLLTILELEHDTQVVLDTDKDLDISQSVATDEYAVLLEKMLTNDSAYLSTLLAIDKATLSLRLAKANQQWDLDLNSSYQYSDDALTDKGWALSLSLKMPLTDLQKKQAYLTAKTELQQQQLKREQQQRRLETDLLNLLRDLSLQQEQVELSTQVKVLAHKKLEIEQIKLNLGRSSNFQLVTFQDDLIQAEQDELTAKIDYLNSLTDLDKMLGTTLDTWQLEVTQ